MGTNDSLLNEGGDGGDATKDTTTTSVGASGDADTTVIGKGTWYEGIDQEIYNDPSLMAFKDKDGNLNGQNIIKSYIHTKKTMGRDKMVIPSKEDGEEAYREVYKKLGLPDDVSQYKLSDKDFEEGSIDDKFRQKAYEVGILPNQAKNLHSWYQEAMQEQENAITAQEAERLEKEFDGLRAKYGQAYDHKLARAQSVIHEVADDKFKEFLQESGLSGHPAMIDFCIKLSENMSEDKFTDSNVQSSAGRLSPDEAQDQINEIMNDPDGAYWNESHMGHASAVAKVKKLYGYLS